MTEGEREGNDFVFNFMTRKFPWTYILVVIPCSRTPLQLPLFTTYRARSRRSVNRDSRFSGPRNIVGGVGRARMRLLQQ